MIINNINKDNSGSSAGVQLSVLSGGSLYVRLNPLATRFISCKVKGVGAIRTMILGESSSPLLFNY